mmetsp:Transcript_3430/g.7485  ORF Transcript_3430/g.7485 Transcript_3430/m.7485 type:complete len:239 (-) Transcript_3430:655-1371(-)
MSVPVARGRRRGAHTRQCSVHVRTVICSTQCDGREHVIQVIRQVNHTNRRHVGGGCGSCTGSCWAGGSGGLASGVAAAAEPLQVRRCRAAACCPQGRVLDLGPDRGFFPVGRRNPDGCHQVALVRLAHCGVLALLVSVSHLADHSAELVHSTLAPRQYSWLLQQLRSTGPLPHHHLPATRPRLHTQRPGQPVQLSSGSLGCSSGGAGRSISTSSSSSATAATRSIPSGRVAGRSRGGG